MHTIITHAITFLIGLGTGAWLYWKFGSKLASDVNKIRSAIR